MAAENLLVYDKLFFDGQWVEPTDTDVVEVVNPATERTIGRVAQASSKDAIKAIAAARRAFDEGPWPGLSPRERSACLLRVADLIERRKDEFVDLLVREAGAPVMMAEFLQLATPLGHFRWVAERAVSFPFTEALPPAPFPMGGLGQGVIRKDPMGVVAAITPFNAPLWIALWKLGPALATGNTVILKPSPYTPLATFLLAEVLQEADLPPGVVNVITGDASVGEELTTNPAVDMVSFTGSDTVGRQIMAQASGTLKRLVLELGGKSPNLIFNGVDIAKVLFPTVMGFTIHCGQGCGLTTRILVEDSIHDAVVEQLVAMLTAMTVGDPSDPAVMMGPLIREAQRERVERYVAAGRDEGGTIVFGGGRPAGLDEGFFVEPTLFTDLENSSTVAQDEIFGPVGVVIRFRDKEEAIRLANDTRYGLMASVWHPDPVEGYELAQRIRAGNVSVNGSIGLNPNGPFGGFKASGFGRELGDHGFHSYVEMKTVNWLVGQP